MLTLAQRRLTQFILSVTHETGKPQSVWEDPSRHETKMNKTLYIFSVILWQFPIYKTRVAGSPGRAHSQIVPPTLQHFPETSHNGKKAFYHSLLFQVKKRHDTQFHDIFFKFFISTSPFCRTIINMFQFSVRHICRVTNFLK